MESIKLIMKGGLGNILKGIPLIKVLMQRYKVYLFISSDLPRETNMQIYKLFENWSARDNRLTCIYDNSYKTNHTLYSPYMGYSYALNGGIVKWNEVSKFGECKLYLNLYSENEKLKFSPTPLYSNNKYDSLKDRYIVSNICKPNWTIKRYPYIKELKKKIDCYEIYDAKSDTLEDIAAMIKYSKGFIGIDSGLSNLAAVTGCRTYIIFGPTSIPKNAPIGNIKIINKNLECIPCQGSGQFKLKAPCPKHGEVKCMDINPNKILKVLDE